jgi:hypothetical protein
MLEINFPEINSPVINSYDDDRLVNEGECAIFGDQSLGVPREGGGDA